MSDAAQLDTLLTAVDRCINSVRQGADARVVHYWWRKHDGEDADFMSTVQAATGQRLIVVLPGEDMRLRLTAQGLAQCQPSPQAAAQAESAGDDDDQQWQAAAPGKDMTPADLQQRLDNIFRVMATTLARPISAASMARIWKIEGLRGADLRRALDQMIDSGELKARRASTTTFQLSEAGKARILAISG